MSIFLIDEVDVQQALAIYLHHIRKQKKLSRAALLKKWCTGSHDQKI